MASIEEAADRARSALEGAIASTMVAPQDEVMGAAPEVQASSVRLSGCDSCDAMLALTIAQRPDALSFMQVAGSGITVVDGDTIRINGRLSGSLALTHPRRGSQHAQRNEHLVRRLRLACVSSSLEGL